MDPELAEVLDLATDEELEELHTILYSESQACCHSMGHCASALQTCILQGSKFQSRA